MSAQAILSEGSSEARTAARWICGQPTVNPRHPGGLSGAVTSGRSLGPCAGGLEVLLPSVLADGCRCGWSRTHEHEVALGQHGRLPPAPGWPAAVSGEQVLQFVDDVRVVHADDPFTPGKVLHRVPARAGLGFQKTRLVSDRPLRRPARLAGPDSNGRRPRESGRPVGVVCRRVHFPPGGQPTRSIQRGERQPHTTAWARCWRERRTPASRAAVLTRNAATIGGSPGSTAVASGTPAATWNGNATR